VANQVDLPFAYVVPDVHKDNNVSIIRSWLAAQDIHLAGRFAEWAYYNSDHAMLAGKRVADQLHQARLTRAATVVMPHISVVPSGSEVQ
jgi:hypothetical protein